MSDYLPSDVLVEILSRLPVKSLLRFTAVSKKWYLLILSPSFISKHLKHSISIPTSKNHFLLVRYTENKLSALQLESDTFVTYAELECPFSRDYNFLGIVGTCNGLICLADTHHTSVVWNPCLKKPINLPNPNFPNIPDGSTVLGFGYDSVNNDYKVVRIVYHLSFLDDFDCHSHPDVEIYSLSTKVWRSICDIAPTYRVFAYSPSPAFVNGHIHWIASRCIENGKSFNLLSGFDVSNEVFREVNIPEILSKIEVFRLEILLWDKSIALVEYDKSWEREYCWIWKMKEYNVVESWARLLKIDMREGFLKVVSLQSTNLVIVFAKGKGLVTYDPQTKRIQSLGRGIDRSLIMDNFMESLVLVEGENRELLELGTSSYDGIDHEILSLELGNDIKTNEQG